MNASPRTIRVEPLGQHLAQRLAGTLDPEEAVALLELVDRDAVLPREPGGRLLARASLGRALDPLVGRLLGKVVDDDREPPRADETAIRPHAELALDELGQLRLRLAARAGGQLLAADLKQQRRPSRLHLDVELRDLAREGAHAADVGRALGHRDRPARVEQVERVRALEHLVVRRQRQPPLEEVPALGLVLGEPPHEHVDRRVLEVVGRPLALVLAVDVAPRDPRRPLEVERRSACPGGTSPAARARR